MATGTPSNKTALRKGFGLMDWVKLTTSTRDLSGVLRMGGLRGYRMEEVARHRTSNDAWAVFAGKVYNLTPYLPYHPGGANIIVKAAGTDCTALFNKHHPWVNLEGLAGKLVVGYLIEEEGATPKDTGLAQEESPQAGLDGSASSGPAAERAGEDGDSLVTDAAGQSPVDACVGLLAPPPKRFSITAAFGTEEDFAASIEENGAVREG
ncbi:hypothetical protein NGA_0331900 [Nannochloropsis gaditana CCMP526]|uniref:Cytochrome b5 reductase 4 n=1 Tax=Nannochloropsis gaditana TaxID=72520 RepID=W7TYU2_9STRA|nr:hypothetical protein NGA_0331900 [Nannochloropsis gaditana CCMP526]EKU20235.1 hypothetical protein NGA_0331900 [Nannochloropsis gaditana CCMP526]EWM25821.1 cytochrome b5 reductase 4 [Nannochloropsis gaditana]|eukprot:XP_005856099.1 hypothetical protein NGA_0331900 [Nannochloropsis gaditana CCMP526]